MKVIGYTRLNAKTDLAGAIVQNGSGIFLKSFDPRLKPFIASYLTYLGSGFLSSVPTIEHTQNGERVIRATPVDWKQSASLRKAAERLTYHRANTEKLVFREMELDDKLMAGAQLLGSPETRCDLLHATKKPTPKCSCFCGSIYQVDKKSCPSCLGDNPLGQALARNRKQIFTKIREPLEKEFFEKMESASLELNALVKDLDAFSKKTQKDPNLPNDEDEKKTAKALIRYWENIFDFKKIRKEKIEALPSIREKKYVACVLAATKTGEALRAAWAPTSTAGWMPDSKFQKNAILHLGKIWKQPIEDVREAYFKVFKAGALYRPIEKSYRSVADRTVWGDLWHSVGKPALVVASAIKTLGLSLAFKATLSLMKSEKERKRYEAFVSAITEATISVQKAIESVEHAARAEKSFCRRLSKGFEIHMTNLLYEDYAKASPNLQQNVVVGLLAKLGLSTSWLAGIRKRQTSPAPVWEKLKGSFNPNTFKGISSIIIITVCVIGLAIWALYLLLR